MSGWTFEVTIAEIKRRTKTVQVRAYTTDEAIEYAKLASYGAGWDESRKYFEYDARELQ